MLKALVFQLLGKVQHFQAIGLKLIQPAALLHFGAFRHFGGYRQSEGDPVSAAVDSSAGVDDLRRKVSVEQRSIRRRGSESCVLL